MNLSLRDSEYELSPDDIAGLRAKYPRADIERELALAHLWLQRNKSRRPANVWRFLDAWLRKASPVPVRASVTALHASHKPAQLPDSGERVEMPEDVRAQIDQFVRRINVTPGAR